ncbi:RING-H2 finger protein ATL22-like [Impatiens glandulifera]|uniref:RING-H2 finger protein ATL22-like n=1 Tax=Impatiens glandulifera TaxID=253017 RepID=UPI001FB112C6|nr:RING-H2 finger protein ATL22-like [Impatiens glandulifera]
MATVSVPFAENNYDFNYLTLTWDRPQCGSCERTDGVCVLKKVGSQDVDCLYPRKVLKAVLFILLSIVIPTSVIMSCCCLAINCGKENPQELNYNYRHITLGSFTTPPQSSTTTTGEGLDESTIQSYPKVIVGESNLTSRLNNKTCPICLSEFLAKETVRFIPNCTHCFHSDCIDEWLRLNHSCPVCRISLTRVNI